MGIGAENCKDVLQGGIGIAAHKNLGSGETTDGAERPRNNKAMK